MAQVALVVAPLFLIMLSTALIRRFVHLDESWPKVLNSLALNIGFPALILSALIKTPFSFSEHAGLLTANSLLVIGTLILGWVVVQFLRIQHRLARTIVLCLAFSNVAYLGIPVLVQVRGNAIIPAASLIVAVYLFWIFTIGVGYLEFSRHEGRRRVVPEVAGRLVRNPLLISVILGLIVGYLGISVPAIVTDALSMVAGSVTPLVLILIGIFIGGTKIGRIAEWVPVFLFSLVTLLLIPAGFVAVVRMLGYNQAEFSASIIESAMPVAVTPFALAEVYDLDRQFVARSIVLSTLLSVITIPFWASSL